MSSRLFTAARVVDGCIRNSTITKIQKTRYENRVFIAFMLHIIYAPIIKCYDQSQASLSLALPFGGALRGSPVDSPDRGPPKAVDEVAL